MASSNKSASVKISLNPSSFIKGLKDIDKQGEKTAKHLESVFDKAISKIEKDADKAAKAFEKSFKNAKISINGAGLINQLDKTGSRGEQAARKIGNGFKKALSAGAGGIGDSTRKLDRAIKELERAQKRLERAQNQASRAKAGREGAELKNKRKQEIWAAEDAKEARASKMSGMSAMGGGFVAGAAAAAGAVIGFTKATTDNEYSRNAANVLGKANEISISSRQAGGQFVDPKQIAAEFFAITQDIKGVTADALADGVKEFVTMTGDLKTARASIKDFAVVASATGADVSEVAGTAAAISQQFNITDPGQIKDVLAALTFQGKSGAFELKDAATLFPKLAAAGASFGLDKSVGGVKTLGGITQIARTATGSGEQAATAVESMLTHLTANAGKLTGMGVNVYDKQGKTRDITDILVESISKVGGSDVGAKNAGLQKIFDTEGKRAINPLISLYNDTFRETKGSTADKTKAAEEAIRAKLRGSIDAVGAWDEVVKDSVQRQKAGTANIVSVQEQLAQVYSQSATPKLNDFMSKLSLTPGALNVFNKAINFGTDIFLGFASVLASLGIIEKEDPTINAKRTVAENLRKEEAGYQEQIAELGTVNGVAPENLEQWKKDNPEEVARRREKIKELEIKRDAAGKVAADREKEVEEHDRKKAEERERKMREYGLTPPTPTPAPAKTPLAGGAVDVKNTVNVKVTNASDIKGNSTLAPGFVPRT